MTISIYFQNRILKSPQGARKSKMGNKENGIGLSGLVSVVLTIVFCVLRDNNGIFCGTLVSSWPISAWPWQQVIVKAVEYNYINDTRVYTDSSLTGISVWCIFIWEIFIGIGLILLYGLCSCCSSRKDYTSI